MAIIWVVESPRSTDWRLSLALLGDYAVRVVASCASLARLAKMTKSNPPDLILVDQSVEDFDLVATQLVVDKSLKDSRLIYVRLGAQTPDAEGFAVEELAQGVMTLQVSTDVDVFRLSRFLRCLMLGDLSVRRSATKEDIPAAILAYKDLVFDSSRFVCNFVSAGTSELLPLKEARILTVLLKKPGACIPRSEIMAQAWPGVRVGGRTIDSHVSRLRKRLEDCEVSIESVYGNGYILK